MQIGRHGIGSTRGPSWKKRGESRAFWDAGRDAKLRYVMETYNDLGKASRVIGVAKSCVLDRWRFLMWQDKKAREKA